MRISLTARSCTLRLKVYEPCSYGATAATSALDGKLDTMAAQLRGEVSSRKGSYSVNGIGTDPMLLLWTESVHNISQRPFR